MSEYSRRELSNSALVRLCATHLQRESEATADVLADLAEIDARKLYLPAAYPSMRAFCAGEFGLTDGAAYKRITAARAARRFPQIFRAVADRRLHLSAVVLLAPHLRPENVDELIEASAGRSKAQVELLLATRYPRADLPTRIEPMPAPPMALRLSGEDRVVVPPGTQLAPGRVGNDDDARSRVSPLSAERVALHVTLDRTTLEKLMRARDLLGHTLPAADVARVIDLALDALITRLELRKFAVKSLGGKDGSVPRRSRNPRYVPAHVRRAVRERDGDRCTFVGDNGRRCESRTRLEFDHIVEVAKGGQATVDGIRLRCRAHNQYTAEVTFGVEFMRHKRDDARRADAGRVTRRSGGGTDADTPSTAVVGKATMAVTPSTSLAVSTVATRDEDVLSVLRRLGFRVDESRDAALRALGTPDVSLEKRVAVALSFLGTRVACRVEKPLGLPS